MIYARVKRDKLKLASKAFDKNLRKSVGLYFDGYKSLLSKELRA